MMRSGPNVASRSSWAVREAEARRSVRLTISPCLGPVDGAVRLFHEAGQALRMPVVASRLPLGDVHALRLSGLRVPACRYSLAIWLTAPRPKPCRGKSMGPGSR